MGPRWRRPPLLIDAAVAALAERPATFLTARDLAEATGRSASGMGNALRRALSGRDVVKTKRGRLVRRVGRGQTSAMYLLIPRGERRAATVERAAWAEWRRGVLEATAAARVAKLAATRARRQARKSAIEPAAKRIVTLADAYAALGL
jgi:hypothetical protein